MKTEYEGIVVAVEDGSSFIVEILNPNEDRFLHIHLDQVDSPKYGNGYSEKFGFEAWDEMRKFVIGKKVFIKNAKYFHVLKKTFIGNLKSLYGQVFIDNGKEQHDIALEFCKMGYLSLHYMNQNSSYRNRLKQEIEKAKNSGKGINSNAEKRKREEKASKFVTIDRVYDCIVVDILSPHEFAIFLLPGYFQIKLEINGVKIAEKPVSGDKTLKMYAIDRKIIHKERRIYITHLEEDKVFGYFVDQSDLLIRQMIIDGFLIKNSISIYLTPYQYVYRKHFDKYFINVNMKYGDALFPNFSFDGKVIALFSNDTFLISDSNRSFLFSLSLIQPPEFIPSGYIEPFGFEVHEYLRAKIFLQNVTVRVFAAGNDRYYGFLYFGEECLNQNLVNDGWAEITFNPEYTNDDPILFHYYQAYQNAKEQKKGKFANNLDPIILKDYSSSNIDTYSLEKLYRKTIKGYIDMIFINHVIIVVDPVSYEAYRFYLDYIHPSIYVNKKTKRVLKYELSTYLQTYVEVNIKKDFQMMLFSDVVINNNGKKKNYVEDIIENGLVSVYNDQKNAKRYAQLYELQQQSKEFRLGIWQDVTNTSIHLEIDSVYSVRVVSIESPIKIGVQLLDEYIKLESILDRKRSYSLSKECTCGDIVLVLFNTLFYRAKIIEIHETCYNTEFLDFAYQKKIIKSHVYVIPPELMAFPPLSFRITVDFLHVETYDDNEISSIWNLTHGLQLYLHITSDSPCIKGILMTQNSLPCNNVNALIPKIMKTARREAPSKELVHLYEQVFK